MPQTIDHPPTLTQHVVTIPAGAHVTVGWHVSDDDFDALRAKLAPDSRIEHFEATDRREAFRSTNFELDGAQITLYGRARPRTAATVTASA